MSKVLASESHSFSENTLNNTAFGQWHRCLFTTCSVNAVSLTSLSSQRIQCVLVCLCRFLPVVLLFICLVSSVWVCIYNIVICPLLIHVHHIASLCRLRLSCIYPVSMVKMLLNNSWLLPAIYQVAHFQDDVFTKFRFIYSLDWTSDHKSWIYL